MSYDNLPTADAQNDDSLPTSTDDDTDIVSGASGDVTTKDFSTVDETNPIAQGTGTTGARKRQVDEDWINEMLADQIYDKDSAFVREFLQNAESATLRAAKYLILHSDEYGADWLTHTLWIDPRTGETVANNADPQKVLNEWAAEHDRSLKTITIPRDLDEIIAAARDLGYDPTIRMDVNHDEREIIVEDNGIGMTVDELDQAYNVTGKSGSRLDTETGGKFGLGALTFRTITGKQAGMDLISRTRKSAEEVAAYNHEGIRAYVYLGGYNPLPNDNIGDSFKGTRFTVPAQDSVKLGEVHDWVQEFTTGLRVPLLYREHRSGETIVKEEYGGVIFHQQYTDAPVVIHCPGEFTIATGPNVKSRHRDPDTWLVSMPIDRNSQVNVRSFWKTVIQIHDEQGRIVAGPNRGKYENEVDTLHEDDVPLPQPTTDRDRLQKDEANKRFFRYVKGLIKERELEMVADIAQQMDEADHPYEAIQDEPENWRLFFKMVDYHGPFRVTTRERTFKKFVNDHDAFPDWNDEEILEVFTLFTKVDFAAQTHYGPPTKKKNRSEERLGEILANRDPDHVFMAASTGGNFPAQYKVVHNTFDDAGVIVVETASKYDVYGDLYGFKLLKEVPLTRGDHAFDIPKSIHNQQVKKGKNAKKTSGEAQDEPQSFEDRVLKFRTDSANSSIDNRRTIRDVKKVLATGGMLGGHRYVVLFPRGGDANISDHYKFSRFAAIASCSQREFEALADHPRVFSYEQFMEFSRETAIATTEGAVKVRDLQKEDHTYVLLYNEYNRQRTIRYVVGDETVEQRFRTFMLADLHDDHYWSDDDARDRREYTLGVVDDKTYERAAPALREFIQTTERPEAGPNHVIGLRLSHSRPGHVLSWRRLNESLDKLRLKAETPNWNNASQAYARYWSTSDETYREALLGFHDAGLDPTDVEPSTMRKLISKNLEDN